MIHNIDFALYGWINAGEGTPLWLIQAGLFVSEQLPVLAFGLIGAVALTRPAWRRAFFVASASAGIAWIAVSLFRWAMPLPRPAYYRLGIQWLAHGMYASFPSMHAAGAFAFAMSLVFARCGALAVGAVAVALLVALSRVFLGVHFPSDVLAGILLGALIALLVLRAAMRWLPGRAYGFSRGTRPIK